MLCNCSFKKRSASTLCSRCGNPCLSAQEYQFVTSDEDEIPLSIDVDKVLKYLVRKLQRRLHKSVSLKVNSMLLNYKRLLLLSSSFSQHVIYLVSTKSLSVLKIATEVFANLSEKIRQNILMRTLSTFNLDVSLILLLVDGLVIGTRFLWDLIKTSDPQSNLYKALLHRVNKSTLAEHLVKFDSKDHLKVLLSESSTLEKKFIYQHLKSSP